MGAFLAQNKEKGKWVWVGNSVTEFQIERFNCQFPISREKRIHFPSPVRHSWWKKEVAETVADEKREVANEKEKSRMKKRSRGWKKKVVDEKKKSWMKKKVAEEKKKSQMKKKVDVEKSLCPFQATIRNKGL